MNISHFLQFYLKHVWIRTSLRALAQFLSKYIIIKTESVILKLRFFFLHEIPMTYLRLYIKLGFYGRDCMTSSQKKGGLNLCSHIRLTRIWRFLFAALPHLLNLSVKLWSEWTIVIWVCTLQMFTSRKFEAPHVFDVAHTNSHIKIHLNH